MMKLTRNLRVWKSLFHCSLSIWVCWHEQKQKKLMQKKVIWGLGSHIICKEGKPEVYHIKEGKMVKKTQELSKKRPNKGKNSIRTTQCHQLANLSRKKIFIERCTFKKKTFS